MVQEHFPTTTTTTSTKNKYMKISKGDGKAADYTDILHLKHQGFKAGCHVNSIHL